MLVINGIDELDVSHLTNTIIDSPDINDGTIDGTAISIANNDWFSGKNYAGTDVVNMLKVNVDDEIDVGGTMVLGASLEAAEDSGAITLVNMPVSATPTAGDEMSFTHKIDGNNILTVGAEADSAGGIQNPKVIAHCGINLKEIATPTAKADYGAVYPKTDNKLYFQDGAGVEHLISNGVYGEGWFYNNAAALTIETADISVAMSGVVVGELSDMTFNSGSTGVTSAFADGTGGTVLVTSAGHGLPNGAIVTIMGSTNYNGVFEVSSVTTDTFKIIDTWVANDGVATWIEPSSLTVNTAGVYQVSSHISVSVSGACTLTWMLYKGITPIPKMTTERKFPNNDIGTGAMLILSDFSVGDVIWVSVQSSASVDITSKHGGMQMHKL